MAESKELVKHLESLAHLDIDAVHAYTSAIDRIDIVEVKQRLTEFRSDHETHISNLSPLIERLGGKVPTRSPDFKGFFIQGFTAIRSMFGNEAALKAMKGNEELTNKTYEKALGVDFPVDILDVVRRNREDERRHLDYINRCIDDRIWDQEKKSVA
jgi:uncharacterized protein (TIGR02284 family)